MGLELFLARGHFEAAAFVVAAAMGCGSSATTARAVHPEYGNACR